MFGQPDHDIETFVAFKNPTLAFSGNSDFHQALDICDIDSEPRQSLPVKLDCQYRQPLDLLGLDVGRALHLLQDGLHLRGCPDQNVEIIPEDLDADVASDA